MRLRLFTPILFVAAIPCHPQGADSTQFAGYVTRITANDGFDVNGQHIIVAENTSIKLEQPALPPAKPGYAKVPFSAVNLYIGEPAEVEGRFDKTQHGFAAERITLHVRQTHPVSGFAIVDAVLPLPNQPPGASTQLIRADGYQILITRSTQASFEKPLTPASAINPNLWVHYRGTEQNDGIVIADEVRFTSNQIKSAEGDLEKSTEYDPSAVPADKKQSGASKFFRGLDVKQIPPSTDIEAQDRVSRIGASLIPAYQAQMAATEATRIDFRFHVLDENKDTAKWRDALTLPNGIILIPHSVVERLQNDSQLATILADNIACALEKQPLAAHVQRDTRTVTQVAGDIGGIFVPGLGIATSIGNAAAARHALHEAEDQSGRVSLSLMKDAGYDVYQAPIAWWLLASKKPQDIANIPLPQRAANLYRFLGESWVSAPAAPAPMASQLSSTQSTAPASNPAAPR